MLGPEHLSQDDEDIQCAYVHGYRHIFGPVLRWNKGTRNESEEGGRKVCMPKSKQQRTSVFAVIDSNVPSRFPLCT